MNDENLKKGEATRFKSGEEAARNGSKGGKASGRARRKQADMRKLLRDMMNEQTKDKHGNVYTYAELMTKSILTIAGSPRQGGASVKAYQTVMHILGMDEPEPKQESIETLKGILEVNKENARLQTDEETE